MTGGAGLEPLQPVGIVRVELDDTEALGRIGRERFADAYAPRRIDEDRYLPPPNVSGLVLDDQLVGALRRAAGDHGVEDLHLRVIRHALPWSDREGTIVCHVPFHLALSYRFAGLRITGPVFVSILHIVNTTIAPPLRGLPWTSSLPELRAPLPPDDRQALIEHHLRVYRGEASRCTDVTVIATPAASGVATRRGPTHRALAGLALAGGVVGLAGCDAYVLGHGGQAPAVDDLRASLIALRGAWTRHRPAGEREGEPSSATEPGHQLAQLRRLYTVVNWIRTSWRAGRGSSGTSSETPA